MPFIASVFVIAGLCSLGLPGLSGFVAEVTVFMGAWENVDGWYRLATVLACASIVVTAVYILRAMGKVIMGPLQVEGAAELQNGMINDARWNEKVAAALLIIGIIAIGVAPFWLTELINQ
jgi:NADH-quinone oxidoreductase subunit M